MCTIIYCICPVGVSGKKKKKKKKKKRSPKRGRGGGDGHTRGQPVMRMGKDGPTFNMQVIFLKVVHSWYLEDLDPPVDLDTDASMAVKMHMCEEQTLKRLIGSVNTLTRMYVLFACILNTCMSCVYVLFVCILNTYMSCVYVLCVCLVCMSCIRR